MSIKLLKINYNIIKNLLSTKICSFGPYLNTVRQTHSVTTRIVCLCQTKRTSDPFPLVSSLRGLTT